MKMRRTHRRINICRMAKNYPRLPISMSSLPFSPFNFTYIWYLPLTLRLQYTDNICNVGNFTLSLTFSVCIIAMPHTQGKLNSPAWAHSQNRGWDPQQHVTKSWLSPHQHWKHAFEIMIETPSPKSCALLGHQLSTHLLLIEFYMISSTTQRSNRTSIFSHGNHSPSYSSIFSTITIWILTFWPKN
jgi:hypothetical protein